jgi:acetyl-CoA synthetase
MTGDAAVEAEDGYYRILGRIDDVINVSGHRLGTKEIESAALVVEEVAEAAVVPVAHDIKGKEPDLYIALKPGFEASDELAKKISDTVCNEIGKIAKPRKVWIVPDMPKTRSGKIMRRVLGAISNKGTWATSPPWPTRRSSRRSRKWPNNCAETVSRPPTITLIGIRRGSAMAPSGPHHAA